MCFYIYISTFKCNRLYKQLISKYPHQIRGVAQATLQSVRSELTAECSAAKASAAARSVARMARAEDEEHMKILEINDI